MRIAHLTTVHKRTDPRIFAKECGVLSAVYDVSLIVADGLGDVHENGISIIDAGKAKSRANRFFSSFGAVRRAVLSSGANIVHFHDPELIPLGVYLKASGLRVIYDAHEDAPRDLLIKEWVPSVIRKPTAFVVSHFEKAAGKLFDGIVTATPIIAGRFPLYKTEIIRNFPLLTEFGEPPPYQGRPELFAHVGTLSEARGVIETIKAFDALNHPRLTLCGKFNTCELECRAKVEPGWRFVDHLGFSNRETVIRTLNRSRAGLCTLLPTQSHIDSYPVKMFEYMAASIPVVASDFPLWRGLLKGIDCALFVNPTRPAEIAAAMKWLLDNPDRAESMGRAGYDAVKNKLNWRNEGERLVKFYERITQGISRR